MCVSVCMYIIRTLWHTDITTGKTNYTTNSMFIWEEIASTRCCMYEDSKLKRLTGSMNSPHMSYGAPPANWDVTNQRSKCPLPFDLASSKNSTVAKSAQHLHICTTTQVAYINSWWHWYCPENLGRAMLSVRDPPPPYYNWMKKSQNMPVWLSKIWFQPSIFEEQLGGVGKRHSKG